MSATPLIHNELFSHGTYECTEMAPTRRFLTEFLGLDIVRPLQEAQYMWKGGPWSVICVCVQDGEAKQQTPLNHFKLSVATEADVDAAHAAALAHQKEFGIKRVLDVKPSGGHRAFKLLDLNNTWWEISTVSQDDFDRAFARGDVRH
jgi:hypothetical protein